MDRRVVLIGKEKHGHGSYDDEEEEEIETNEDGKARQSLSRKRFRSHSTEMEWNRQSSSKRRRESSDERETYGNSTSSRHSPSRVHHTAKSRHHQQSAHKGHRRHHQSTHREYREHPKHFHKEQGETLPRRVNSQIRVSEKHTRDISRNVREVNRHNASQRQEQERNSEQEIGRRRSPSPPHFHTSDVNYRRRGHHEQGRVMKHSKEYDKDCNHFLPSSSPEKPRYSFRKLPVFPTLQELRLGDQPLLQKNLVQGKYRDINHYLDVQFRLMREDFVAPLRDGISSFLTEPSKCKGAQDIRVYNDVQILRPVCARNAIVYRVHFECSTRVSWNATKRLLHGALLCLSDDNFQTAIFGTVTNRNPRSLAQGLLDIEFQDSETNRRVKHLLCTPHNFVMVETVAFFEAYRHVLQGLKEITEKSLPFQKHILNVSPHVKVPKYFRHKLDVTFNLTALLKENIQGVESAHNIRIMDRSAWPKPGHMQLDGAQLEAVYTALTTNFSVIQGPPGTGKTHVGLKIMQVLLENRCVWDKDERRPSGPILVVCHTNHALDQFLEGALKFTSSLVRVGANSKSEHLSQYNLSTIRNDPKFNYLKRGRRKKCLTEAYEIRSRIEHHVLEFDTTYNGVVSIQYLYEYMTDAQWKNFTGHRRFSSESMDITLYWLELYGDFKPYQTQVSNSRFTTCREGQSHASDDVDFYNNLDVDIQDDWYQPACNSNIDSHLVIDLESFARDYHQHGQLSRQAVYHIAKSIQALLNSNETLSKSESTRIKDMWAIPFKMKWALYRVWLSRFRKRQMESIKPDITRYDQITAELEKITEDEDYQILADADVIGMTTTRAARNRAILQRVKPKIIIIEEAAEVLESHIVTTLSDHCQQLILIGDHQQLRPTPAVFRLAKEFNLEISLFERMVKNGLFCPRLIQQHRMRPEISEIMRRHYYENLQDHESVTRMANVKGVCNNVFFLDHSHTESTNKDIQSKSNTHEASFLIALCRYLLQQGYKPSQITILTTYTGQLFTFNRLMDRNKYAGVRVSVVDNYQGEENDIILLSLVRSNNIGKIGFLDVPNRVCVALSRARQGLFCIGNFEQLSNESGLWKDITRNLTERKLLGKALVLECSRHKTKVEVTEINDFAKVPEGGCTRPCEFRLDCGHVCKRKCHSDDSMHENYKCMMTCSKIICDGGHLCKAKCHQPCETSCLVKIEKVLPRCGHKHVLPCHRKVEFVTCPSQCERTLTCGHKCSAKCGEPCNRACDEKVKKDLDCGHSAFIECSAPLAACPILCNDLLRCDHKCPGTCGSCLQGRVHQACTQECGRILVCGHQCKEPCTSVCPPCKRQCENQCVHSKCPKACGEVCPPCQEQCQWQCKHIRCTKSCGAQCDRDVCNEPCLRKIQRCQHQCIGLCGEPCLEKCRICNHNEVTEIFFGTEEDKDARFVLLEDCGHSVEVTGLDHWMNMADECQSGETISIQMKSCPKCKTPIRRSLRYGNIVKKMLADIEKVKKQMRGNVEDVKKSKKETKTERKRLLDSKLIDVHLAADVRERLERCLGLQEVVNLRNELLLFSSARKLQKKVQDLEDTPSKNMLMKQLDLVLERFFNKVTPMRGSDQELDEFNLEIERLHLCWQTNMVKARSSCNVTNQPQIVKYTENLESLLMDGTPLSVEKKETVKDLLQKASILCGGLGISEDERQMVVKAVGLSKGHWYKCPNGHVYAIGDCGGAMVEAKCPECGATIGGRSHRLRGDNALAKEMDGATHSAWSDQANIENYDLQDLN